MRDNPKPNSYFYAPISQLETTWRPRTDIYKTSSGWLLKFELAGVRPGDVSICITGNAVNIGGMRRDCMMEEDCSYYCMEISYNRFERSIELPCDLSQAQFATEFRDGILLVRITTEGR